MHRDTLDADSGMLFDFKILGKTMPTVMWMKDTKVSLDMIFVNEYGEVYWIYENAKPLSTELIKAPRPAFGVLEVNAGDVKKHGIKVGDIIKSTIFEEKIKNNPNNDITVNQSVSVSEDVNPDIVPAYNEVLDAKDLIEAKVRQNQNEEQMIDAPVQIKEEASVVIEEK